MLPAALLCIAVQVEPAAAGPPPTAALPDFEYVSLHEGGIAALPSVVMSLWRDGSGRYQAVVSRSDGLLMALQEGESLSPLLADSRLPPLPSEPASGATLPSAGEPPSATVALRRSGTLAARDYRAQELDAPSLRRIVAATRARTGAGTLAPRHPLHLRLEPLATDAAPYLEPDMEGTALLHAARGDCRVLSDLLDTAGRMLPVAPPCLARLPVEPARLERGSLVIVRQPEGLYALALYRSCDCASPCDAVSAASADVVRKCGCGEHAGTPCMPH